MQVLPVINESVIQEVESAIKEFLWKGKHEKIKLNVLQLKKTEGGLGLVNI